MKPWLDHIEWLPCWAIWKGFFVQAFTHTRKWRDGTTVVDKAVVFQQPQYEKDSQSREETWV